MIDPEFIAVIIGIVGALIGVYFREAIKKAQARLTVAVILESNLYYWFNLGMTNKHLREFLVTGHIFGEKEKEAILSKDIKKIEEFRNKVEDGISKAKEKFFEEQDANIDEILRSIKALSQDEYTEVIKEIESYKDRIIDENGFLGQEKLSVLNWHKLPQILEIKAEIQSIIFDLKLGIIHVYTNEKPDKEKVKSLFYSMITSVLKASKNIIPLMKYSKSIRERGLLGNIFS